METKESYIKTINTNRGMSKEEKCDFVIHICEIEKKVP